MILQNVSLFQMNFLQSFMENYVTWRTLINLIDILVVWFVLYKLISLLRDTKAIQVFKGIAIIIVVRVISSYIGLNTVSWLMNQVITYGVLAAIVIFQPEVRRGLEYLGRGPVLSQPLREKGTKQNFITALDEALQYMARRKIGALITIQQKDSLSELVDTGIILDADVSSQLLINIFIPNTPLHDGAVIIKNQKISSASSYLPLSESSDIPKEYGTRHRAAIGVSEVTDALTLIVSEETGGISITTHKKFYSELSREEYLNILNLELTEEGDEVSSNRFERFLNDIQNFLKKGDL